MEDALNKVIVEKNIPFIKGLIEPYAQVEYLAADEFTPATVKDADALIVRTRTKCDAALLAGSRVKLVDTATIGTDHIDLEWCAANGIDVANAPGCNAPAVAQYVFASLLRLANRPLSQYRIGIVGVGHVGKIVERWARAMDMEVMLNDPPRQAAEGGDHWSTLEEIAEKCDIITVHTPLDASTRHLVDGAFVAKLKRSPILINAARGPIFDTQAVLDGLADGKIRHAVIDCWENEPRISVELLKCSSVATPHIAGYSYEGKVRATRMALDALSQRFGLPHIAMEQAAPDGAPLSDSDAATEHAAAAHASAPKPLRILQSYDPMADTAALRRDPSQFESLRNTYSYRHEP